MAYNGHGGAKEDVQQRGRVAQDNLRLFRVGCRLTGLGVARRRRQADRHDRRLAKDWVDNQHKRIQMSLAGFTRESVESDHPSVVDPWVALRADQEPPTMEPAPKGVLAHPDLVCGRSLAIKAWRVLARTNLDAPADFMTDLTLVLANYVKESKELSVDLPATP